MSKKGKKSGNDNRLAHVLLVTAYIELLTKHVSNKTVANWENGKAEPSAATVKTLTELYKIPIGLICMPHTFT